LTWLSAEHAAGGAIALAEVESVGAGACFARGFHAMYPNSVWSILANSYEIESSHNCSFSLSLEMNERGLAAMGPEATLVKSA
jgi:hypothetical protein